MKTTMRRDRAQHEYVCSTCGFHWFDRDRPSACPYPKCNSLTLREEPVTQGEGYA